MIELIAHNLAPIMFLSLIVFLLLGYPVSFSLAANGLLFFWIAVELSTRFACPGRCSRRCPSAFLT
jgi:TRAP-type mannitol/chloroaromatic compound transport system permease large subunit